MAVADGFHASPNLLWPAGSQTKGATARTGLFAITTRLTDRGDMMAKSSAQHTRVRCLLFRVLGYQPRAAYLGEVRRL